MEIIFWISVVLIFYTYVGYFMILKLLVALPFKTCQEDKKRSQDCPMVSVIISAFNEEKAVESRIKNLLEQNYPAEKLEIIVASDGSTDDTVEIARSIQQENIIVLDFKENRGRALLQNDAVKAAHGEIIILTDAETEFEKDFVKNMVRYYENPIVGCGVGNLKYKMSENLVCADEGLYFRYEKEIRALEDKLGILAKTTGACMSVRKQLWQELLPTDDTDFTTPLDVLLKGHRVAYAEDAIAYDVPPATIKNEFKTRIRQSNKNLYGTLRKWKIQAFIKHPFISWGKYSVPFLMVGAFLSNLFLLPASFFYQITCSFQIVFYLSALLGFIANFVNIRIPIISTITSFVVANLGIMIGVFNVFLGNIYSSYRPLKNE
jgi:biofilm PGA synthesis N-glycosyltransferase PgaC